MSLSKLRTNQMLFRVTDRPIVEDNPNIESIPELFSLSDRNLKYICLVWDYESPFKKVPFEQRKEEVARHLDFKYEKDGKRLDKNARDVIAGNVDSINRGVVKFKSLIYDEDKETLSAIKDLISNIRDFIRDPSTSANDYDKKVKMAQNLPNLEETKKRLATILGIHEEPEPEEEKKEENLSTLDMVNQQLI